MKIGFIFECGPGGADKQVCEYLARKLLPDVQCFSRTLDNKANLLKDAGRVAAALLADGCERVLISMSAALARALAAQAAAVVPTTAFRRRALQVAVQSAAKRFRRGFIPRQLNLPALAGKSLSKSQIKLV